ncbi:hypothetical protein BD410DRAFT_902791 [Rickenella mellea]|uniref:Ricin B lectin domain-containing protein n=1 Tax=Rickenella mellea TaxID=50990 RepID=A0A4Y7PJ00_9AGAM|nr:hypothetical protein BD410DRAFT_902791 [Rickenella mellea]
MPPTVIQTGLYLIRNVKFKNLAILPDANDESALTANAIIENHGDEKWNITLLGNGNYHLSNLRNSRNAGCVNRSQKGDGIFGTDRAKQFVIKETRVKNQFTISPTDADLFWGLEDGEESTPITLQLTPTDGKNQWIFESTR